MSKRKLPNGPPRTCLLQLWAASACVLLVLGCRSGVGSADFGSTNPLAGPKHPTANTSRNKPKPPDNEFAVALAQAQNLERANQLDEARKVYEELIATCSDSYQPYHRLAVVADRQRRFREAEALYAEAIRLQPQHAELFNDLGYCFFLQGDLGKAEAAGLKAVALAPSNPRFRNNLGMILAHQGRHEEALEQFRQAGSEADAMYNLAFVLAAKDNVEGAKNCFQLALAADPTYEPARKALESFQRFEANVQQPAALAANGARWVPYVEGSESDGTAVRTASQTTPAPSGRLVPSTRSDTQSQLKRARTMMAETIQPPAQ